MALTESSSVSLNALIASVLEHFVYYMTIFMLSGLIPYSFKSSACSYSCLGTSVWTGNSVFCYGINPSGLTGVFKSLNADSPCCCIPSRLGLPKTM